MSSQAVHKPGGRAARTDLLPERFRTLRLYPVGRLDTDTTGLLILTNDGELAQRLTHPRHHVEKEYHATLDGELNHAALTALRSGVAIEGGHVSAPARVDRLPGETPRYRVVLGEGRKRQVRLMFRAVGRWVIALSRDRIGGVRLGGLAGGAVAELTGAERQALARGFGG